jgi:hypothetical protein
MGSIETLVSDVLFPQSPFLTSTEPQNHNSLVGGSNPPDGAILNQRLSWPGGNIGKTPGEAAFWVLLQSRLSVTFGEW